MKKIRNFRLRLHFKDIRRRAKRKFDLDALDLGDANLVDWLDEAERRMSPAVIYESFGPDSETIDLAPIPGLAHTIGIATLGPGVSKMIEEAAARSEERGRMCEMIARVALDQSVQFVLNLLKDDVEKDRCELSPIQIVEEAEPLKRLYDKLGGAKIEVDLTDGRLAPALTRAFCLSWILKGRRSKKKKPPKAKSSK